MSEETSSRSPGPNDVLMGRGKGHYKHEGNVTFRANIDQYCLKYKGSSDPDKTELCSFMVNLVKEDGGRFLEKSNNDGCWQEVDDDRAMSKARSDFRSAYGKLIKASITGGGGQEAVSNPNEGDVEETTTHDHSETEEPDLEDDPVLGRGLSLGSMHLSSASLGVSGMSLGALVDDALLQTVSTEDREEEDEEKPKNLPTTQIDAAESTSPRPIQPAVPTQMEVVMHNTEDPNVELVPTPSDVLCKKGTSKTILEHRGNVFYRDLVSRNCESYVALKDKDEKKVIIDSILNQIEGAEPPGRFLDHKDGKWKYIPRKDAEEKVRQALCDKARKNKKAAEKGGGGCVSPDYQPNACVTPSVVDEDVTDKEAAATAETFHVAASAADHRAPSYSLHTAEDACPTVTAHYEDVTDKEAAATAETFHVATSAADHRAPSYSPHTTAEAACPTVTAHCVSPTLVAKEGGDLHAPTVNLPPSAGKRSMGSYPTYVSPEPTRKVLISDPPSSSMNDSLNPLPLTSEPEPLNDLETQLLDEMFLKSESASNMEVIPNLTPEEHHDPVNNTDRSLGQKEPSQLSMTMDIEPLPHDIPEEQMIFGMKPGMYAEESAVMECAGGPVYASADGAGPAYACDGLDDGKRRRYRGREGFLTRVRKAVRKLFCSKGDEDDVVGQ